MDLSGCKTWSRILEVLLHTHIPSILVKDISDNGIFLFFTKRISLLCLSRMILRVQVHYERQGENGLPSLKEITVMFLPSISDIIPSTEVWQARWRARQQAKLESEAAAKKTKVGFEAMNVWE